MAYKNKKILKQDKEDGMPTKYTNIDGFFDFSHLYDRMVSEAKDGDLFVEIGSWKGCSACYMAELIQESGKNIELICIDTWTGNVFGDGKLGDSFSLFKGNLEAQGITVDRYGDTSERNPHIVGVVQDSQSAASIFDDESLQFVYLDGAHGYENVVREIELYLPKIKRGGYLGGHDFPDDNVNRAVRDTLGLNNVEHITNVREPDVFASFLYRKTGKELN